MAIKLGDLILKEYSDKIVKKLVERYKKQNPNLDEEMIRYYIVRFDQLKNSIRQRFEKGDEVIMKIIPKENQDKNKYLDILNWNRWTDLEKIIDIFPAPPSQIKKSAEASNDAEIDADKVYDKDKLEIYKGDAQHKCIRYGTQMGNAYSWCIARPNSSNMYSNYRFMRAESRMFYFVFDRTRSSRKNGGSFQDKFHAVVIHVYEDGRYGFSNADNAGDSTAKDWNELGKYMPAELWAKIQPLKEVFKYNPPSQEEKEMAALSGKKLTLEQFAELSFNVKLQYINAGNKLTPEQIETLNVDLKNQYINIGNPMPFDAIKDNVPLMKRYITIQFIRKDKPVNADYLEYMDDDMKATYYKKYKDESQLNHEHIIKYFPEHLEEYIKELLIDNFVSLPDYMEKYMNEEQKRLNKALSPAYNNTKFISTDDPQNMVKNYYLTPDKMSLHTKEGPGYEELDPTTRKTFCNLVKKLYSSNQLDKHPVFKSVLPAIEVKNGILYFGFGKKDDIKWYDENGRPSENLDELKRSMQVRAGIIR